jgi:hypothetical protein
VRKCFSSSKDISMSIEIQEFLSVCTKMVEVAFHNRIVKPFLLAIGAQNLQYTHGSNERGKDFLYTVRSAYGKDELHACVVKNGKFNARANDSNSVQTALGQIQTSRKVVSLNPLTGNHEIPRSVCFISTHDIPDKATGNYARQLSELSEYCTFLTGEAFAKKFCELCNGTFRETLKPGSFISSCILKEVGQHSEAVVFKLPSGPSARVYVDMRLVSESKTLAKYIERKRRPKAITAEHAEKSLVDYSFALSDSLRGIIDIPAVFDIDRINKKGSLSENTSEKGKVSVRSINLDKLYDCVVGLHNGSYTLHQDDKRADVCFGLHGHLGALLEAYGQIEYSTPVESNSLGVFGQNLDAIDALANCSDNLLINGDPGGGKTFTAQELTIRLTKMGKQTVYFPCSKIANEAEDLTDAIVKYVAAISSCGEDEASRYVETADVIVVDGLDEAISLESGLIHELESLAFPNIESIKLPNGKIPALECLTEGIRSKVRLLKRKSESKLEVLERLNWIEAQLICSIIFDSVSERVEVSKRLLSCPRVIATCRSTSNAQLTSCFRKVKLLPFSEEELQAFILGHCSASNFNADKLIQFLNRNSYIHEVCRSPLTASIMIGIFLRGGDLPSSRAELYNIRCRLLMQEWDQARGVIRPTEGRESSKELILKFLAYTMHKMGIAEIAVVDALKLCKNEFSQSSLGSSVDEIFFDLITHHGLLCKRGDDFLTFGHLSHQEFFCAQYMILRAKLRELATNFGSPKWKNVTHFYVGLMQTADVLLEEAQRLGKLVGHASFVQELTAEGQFSGDFSRVVNEFNVIEPI